MTPAPRPVSPAAGATSPDEPVAGTGPAGPRGLLGLAREGFAAALGAGTARRGARVFHPHGQAYRCRLTVTGGGSWGARLLDEPAAYDGVVRLSRGAGLPQGLPDVDGLALRLPGLGVGGGALDILVNSAWRFVFAPSVLSATWSCVLPYRTATGDLVLLGARPQPGGFAFTVAAPLGRWLPWGRLELGEPVAGEAMRFVPTAGVDDLVPVALFRALRARSYERSQAARAQPPPADPEIPGRSVDHTSR